MSKSVVTRALSAAIVLAAIVSFSSIAPVSAQATSISERIAEAKLKVWGEYPKAEQAWPEFKRPVAVVAAAPVQAEVKTVAKTEAKAEVKAESQVETKTEVKKAAPAAEKVEVKAAAPVEAKEAAAPVTTPETQVVAAKAVEVAPVNVVTSTGDMWIDEIVRLTNEARSAEGLAPLSINTTLNQGAAIRVPELPSSPAPHVRPNGDPFYTIYGQIGMSVKAGGENYCIASANAFTPEQIVNAWLASPGHRANIMNAKYTRIGVGHGVIGENEYFEQLFAN